MIHKSNSYIVRTPCYAEQKWQVSLSVGQLPIPGFKRYSLLWQYWISLPKVIWEEGRVAAKVYTYAVKSPLVTMARPISPQRYPFSWTDPQTPLPASSLDPSDLWCQTASGPDPPFFHNALDRPTHVKTGRSTDISSTGKFDDYSPLRL